MKKRVFLRELGPQPDEVDDEDESEEWTRKHAAFFNRDTNPVPTAPNTERWDKFFVTFERCAPKEGNKNIWDFVTLEEVAAILAKAQTAAFPDDGVGLARFGLVPPGWRINKESSMGKFFEVFMDELGKRIRLKEGEGEGKLTTTEIQVMLAPASGASHTPPFPHGRVSFGSHPSIR